MDESFNMAMIDLIRRSKTSFNFNDELIIVTLDGLLEKKENLQMDAFSLILVLEGTLDITINGVDHHVCAPAFADIFGIHIVQSICRSSNFRGYYVILTLEFMEEVMQGIKRLPLSNFLSHCGSPIIEIEEREAVLLEQILFHTIKNTQRTDHLYQRDILKNAIRGLLIETSNIIMHKGEIQNDIPFKSRENTIARFVHLINKHCKEEHSVDFYARELCIDAKYLSRILKSVNGKTARLWIDEAIIIHARMLLKDPELTIQRIADILHFSDQSAFGKFFKKHCGLSPVNYRREQL